MKIRNKKTGEIREFDCTLINSSKLSAQNRQRLYWCGKRNPDGTYSTVQIEQPEDRGILLRDILETGVAFNEKCYTLKAQYYKSSAINAVDGGHFPAPMVAEAVNTTSNGKSYCLPANRGGHSLEHDLSKGKYSYVAEPIRVGTYPTDKGTIVNSQSKRIYSVDGKACSVCASCTGGNGDTSSPATRLYAEPVRIGTIESETSGTGWDSKQYRVYSPEGKSVTLCGCGGGVGAKTGLYAVPTDCDVVVTKKQHSLPAKRQETQHSSGKPRQF